MRGVRLGILACAAFSAMLAMWFMRSALESRANVPVQVAQPAQQPVQQKEEQQVAEVLVAARDVSTGTKVKPEDVRWQKWPADAVSPYFYTKAEDPDAIATLEGAAARFSMRAGEPLTTEKVIDLDGAGVMASLLRKGMRAVAVPISEETAAGGFVLPGDFVDILLTRQITIEEINRETGEVERSSTHNQTDTVMEYVRVVAVDQRLNEEGQVAAIGNTATVELTPEQAELVTLTRQIAKQERGFLTLSLRSFSEMVAEFGDGINEVMPVTKLDLRELAEAKRKRARELQEEHEKFRREQDRRDEIDRLRRIEEERMRMQLAAQAAAAAAAQEQVVPAEPNEDAGIVLIRNGAPIVVKTIERPEAEEGIR